MGRDETTGLPLQEADGLGPMSDPAQVHGQQVDDRGLDLASLVHQLALAVCEELGRPCGLQANLPEGLCVASMTPCRHASGGSRRPYAVDEAFTSKVKSRSKGKR